MMLPQQPNPLMKAGGGGSAGHVTAPSNYPWPNATMGAQTEKAYEEHRHQSSMVGPTGGILRNSNSPPPNFWRRFWWWAIFGVTFRDLRPENALMDLARLK